MSRQSRIRKGATLTTNGMALAASKYDRMVVINAHRQKMLDFRTWARTNWGDKYLVRTVMYKSQILKVCQQRKCGAVEATVKHILPVLGNSKKLQGVGMNAVKVAMFSAALDLCDENSNVRD